MFRGFKYQVVLPVAGITLLLICLSAIGFSIWAMQQEQSVVRQQVADNVTSIQGVFVTTAALMQDRTHASMALLQEQIRVRGGAEKGSPVSVAGKTVNDILIGGKGQAGDFAIVDYVTRLNKGTATIFSKDGEHFVRIATNVMKEDGTRAVGTELNNTTPAYAELKSQRAFYGVVDILGNPYFTAYEPLVGKNGESIGIAYVGYKAELPVLSQALEQAHLLKSGFVAVIDSSKARYMPSWVTPEKVQEATANKDGSWVINRTPLPEWGLTIVSAYPAAELRAQGQKVGFGVALAGIILGAAISATLFFLLDRKVLHLLGGEPRVAADYMKRIADGDLAVDIAIVGARPDSLMASLKVMEMKLKNLVSAVRGGAAEVSEQSHKFEAAFVTFQKDPQGSSSQEIVKLAKGISRTLALLEKSVARFRL
ncbi:MAG TPA: Cache 3/Cache 2 fusion domain-containing protein [Steroidobacteraceae bacterium]|nr:Cache 3/Cache 2 fusion domain-containing protein [Steroidobacteraceae bacterium]